jgi:CheY-like chemotaxis protein
MAGERKRRILVVEDEALIAMDLERIVRRAGCEVVGPVGRAEEALRLAAEGRPDAAILDIELSDGDSFAVADALARRRVPFVFVTGSAPAALPERFRGRPLIQKPTTPPSSRRCWAARPPRRGVGEEGCRDPGRARPAHRSPTSARPAVPGSPARWWSEHVWVQKVSVC